MAADQKTEIKYAYDHAVDIDGNGKITASGIIQVTLIVIVLGIVFMMAMQNIFTVVNSEGDERRQQKFVKAIGTLLISVVLVLAFIALVTF